MCVVIKQGVCTSTVHDCLCFIFLLLSRRVMSVLYVGPIVVKMCRFSANNLSRRIVFRQGVMSVLCVGPIVVKMCRLSATNLSRRIVFRRGGGGGHVCTLCWP